MTTTPNSTLVEVIDAIAFDVTMDGINIITNFDAIKEIAPFTKYPDLWINAVAVYPAVDGNPAVVRAFQARTHSWNSALRNAVKFGDISKLDDLYYNDIDLVEVKAQDAIAHWTNAVIGNSVVINTSSRFSALLGHGSCDGPFCFRTYMKEIEALEHEGYLANVAVEPVYNDCPSNEDVFLKLLDMDINGYDIPF